MRRPLDLLALAAVVSAVLFPIVAFGQLAAMRGPPIDQSGSAVVFAPLAVTAPEEEFEEVQRHFRDALAAITRKDYRAAAADLRQAMALLRLEASRADVTSKEELDVSAVQLDTLATAVESGAMIDANSIAKVFARVDFAVALEHRAKAAESWANNEYVDSGRELMAAARVLHGAAGWVGGQAEADADASRTSEQIHAMGDKLVAGAAWTRDEVVRAFEALSASVDALGRRIDSTHQASTFDAPVGQPEALDPNGRDYCRPLPGLWPAEIVREGCASGAHFRWN